ncbi:MAG: hypothetical protein K2Z80_30175 [Xanthobacteraceae bacterium]|nr:hypothetical protein [Xanthobacteraceae bacterium]
MRHVMHGHHGLAGAWPHTPPSSPGHSRPKDGVALLAHGRPKAGVALLAYGRPKDGVALLAYDPAIHEVLQRVQFARADLAVASRGRADHVRA